MTSTRNTKIFENNSTEWSDFADSGEPVISQTGTDIVEITIDEVDVYLDYALDTSTITDPIEKAYDLPSILLYGDPGIGKSSIVRSYAIKQSKVHNRIFIRWNQCSIEQKLALIAAPEKYYVLVDIRAAQVEPSDFSGIPKIQSAEKYIEMNPHKWVYFMSLPHTAGILFLDELNQADRGVLKAAFQVVLDREAGEVAFSKNWGIVAAGNLGSVYNEPIPVALTSRFEVYYVKADADNWLKWARQNGIHTSVTDFVDSNKAENFYALPAEGSSNPYPNPRQLAALSTQIKKITSIYQRAIKAKTPITKSIFKVIGDKAGALCGVNWAHKFVTFLRHSRTFKWAEIVKAPATHFDKKQLDRLTALILYTRRMVIDTLNEKSSSTPAEKVQFCKELVGIFDILDNEWKTILLNYIHSDDKEVLRAFTGILLDNKADPGLGKFITKTLPLIKKTVNGDT